MEQVEKWYRSRDLFWRLERLGLSTGKMWIWREERAGRLLAARDAKNRRKFTAKNIEEIIKAYGPGGCGYWSYDGSLSPLFKKHVKLNKKSKS